MSPIFYTMFGWGMENGGEKSGEKRVFFVVLLRGERGVDFGGAWMFYHWAYPKKSPKLGRKKGERGVLV